MSLLSDKLAAATAVLPLLQMNFINQLVIRVQDLRCRFSAQADFIGVLGAGLIK